MSVSAVTSQHGAVDAARDPGGQVRALETTWSILCVSQQEVANDGKERVTVMAVQQQRWEWNGASASSVPQGCVSSVYPGLRVHGTNLFPRHVPSRNYDHVRVIVLVIVVLRTRSNITCNDTVPVSFDCIVAPNTYYVGTE
jgi:hypothetical protein